MFNLFKKTHKDESLEEQKIDLLKYPSHSKICLEGQNCNELQGAVGEFGIEPTNPIPVNGPLGEIKYLNRLVIKNGPGLMFHRIGSVEVDNVSNPIDVFEVVSVNAKVWDILYFDMYHPRRSIKVPERYDFAPFHEVFSRLPIGYGLTDRDVNFPFNIPRIIENRYDLFGTKTMGRKLAEQVQEIIGDGQNFKRPKEHEETLKKVVALLSPTAYYQIDAPFP